MGDFFNAYRSTPAGNCQNISADGQVIVGEMQIGETVLQNQGAKIPSGWILQFATDISEDGTVITGWGISPHVQGSEFGQTEPWRAVLPVVC